MNTVIVIDGSTLSLLLYTHTNGNGNQLGFLLGHRAKDTQNRISDSQIHMEDTKCYIYVSSFVPWPDLKYLHRRGSSINIRDFHKAYDGVGEEVIGWYSFRHHSSLRPSLKEMSTHHQLKAMEDLQENQDFLFFLCTSSSSPNLSTHSSDHAFMRYDLCSQKFKAVTTSIRNLGDTPRSEYQKPSMTLTIHSHQAQDVVKKSMKVFVRPTGKIDQVIKMKEFAESMGKSLSSLQVQVNKSEANIYDLETEVRYLRKKMAHLETKDMSLTFDREQQRMNQEKEDNLQKESIKETDEEEQINKLLTDLGLPTDIASNLFHKPEEKSRKLSQDQDDLISWEKMEVNPLYASTLDSSSSLRPNPEHFQPASQKTESADSAPSQGQNIDEMIETPQENVVLAKEKKKTPNSSHVSEHQPNDPFDFVEQFKSELNGCNANSSTLTSHDSNQSNVVVSTKPSAIKKNNKIDRLEEDKSHSETESSICNDANMSSSAKSNGCQLIVSEPKSSQETSSKLSSSPIF